MLKIVGALLIINALVITAWWVMGEHPHKGWAFTLCLSAVFVGAFLVLQERVTELTVKGIGTIKSAAEQASADAIAISELKERVEAQSATVNLIAKEAADAKQLVNDLSEKNSIAESKLSQLDKSINDGNLAVKELQLYTQFNTTVLSAQNDSRRAYDQLWAWSEDSPFPFQKAAAQAVQTIMDQHNPAMIRSGFRVSWNEGVDPQKLSSSELWQAFKSAPPHIRLGILEFVWEKRTDITKRDRLQFLVDVLRSDESLQVVEYAGRYFAQGTGDKLKPIAIGPHLKWWEEHKDSIE
jgi:hypothetical protein